MYLNLMKAIIGGIYYYYQHTMMMGQTIMIVDMNDIKDELIATISTIYHYYQLRRSFVSLPFTFITTGPESVEIAFIV